MSKAIIIGAGLGGLALGIRLQAAGVATTLIDARDQPGGRLRRLMHENFNFDASASWAMEHDSLCELCALVGADLAGIVELLPVIPVCRYVWPDGTTFDTSNDEIALHREIERIAPQDIAGYAELSAYSAGVARDFSALGPDDFATRFGALPMLTLRRAWRSVFARVRDHISNVHLQQAFSCYPILTGCNPMSTSCLTLASHIREKQNGTWYARGGTQAVVNALATLYTQLGGTLRLGDPVIRIETSGDHATGATCASGWSAQADMLASAVDPVHTYAHLLKGSGQGRKLAGAYARMPHSAAQFILHFGIKGTWPGIPHHSILFGPRYEGLLTDIFRHGILPRDMLIMLHHPSLTDTALAPEGHSVFSAHVLVPHLGKLPVDWNGGLGAMMAERVLDEIERRLIPDIRARIVTQFHVTPADTARDLNAYQG
ncbi:MAG: phytoene desaturase, partial [Alphaproteobacteria bacterium]|nr:phytoene desaturase [Alphaproteobacteria bacterium]